MGNIAATLSLNVPAITALCKGYRGTITLTGSAAPTITDGISGDYYIDYKSGLYYGPKTDSWGGPLFTLGFAPSSIPFTVFGSSTSLIVPNFGVNNLSGSFLSIVGGTRNVIRGNYSSILGGVNNSLTGTNSFIIGSNISASNVTDFTLVNNLSSLGVIYATGDGNSTRWASSYTTLTSNSAIWNTGGIAYLNVVANSGRGLAAYSNVNANSGSWQSVFAGYNAASATYMTISSTFSGLAYTIYPLLTSIRPVYGTNNAGGSWSHIAGGNFNSSSGNYSSINGGFSGLATASYASIGGGVKNTASAYAASVGGGECNASKGSNSFIGSGRLNTASGAQAGVVAGISNIASGNCSYIAGGSTNDTNSQGNTFILGSNLKASAANYTYVNNISAQGTATANILTVGNASKQTATIRGGSGQVSSSLDTTNLNGSLVIGDEGNAAGNGGALYFAATNQSSNFAAIKGYLTDSTPNSKGDLFISTRRNVTDVTLTEAMRIANSGNVGIGTSSPAAKLQVANGAIMPAAGNTTSAGIQFPDGATSDAAWIRYYNRTGESATLEIGVNNDTDDHIYFNPSGNVGIGTNTPGAKLDVSGAISVTGNITKSGSVKPATWGGGVTSFDLYSDGGSIGAGTAGSLAAYFNKDGNAYFSGQIGIGITLDKVRTGVSIDTSAAIRADGEIIGTGGGDGQARYIAGNYGVILRNDGANYYTLLTDSGKQYDTWNSYRPLTIGLADSLVGINSSLYVKSNGNVGIGTSTPGTKLAVAGDIYSSGNIQAASPWEFKPDSYTLTDADCGKTIALYKGSQSYLSIPATTTVFRPGFQVTIVRWNVGAVTINAGSGVVLHQAYNLLNLAARYSAATLVYSGDNGNGWVLFGDLA